MKQYRRTGQFGTVVYGGQRSLVVKAIEKLPDPFALEQVVSRVDGNAYARLLRTEKSIPQSVQHHLRKLTKLGQLERINREVSMGSAVSKIPLSSTPANTVPGQLLAEWGAWQPGTLPHLLPGDARTLMSGLNAVNIASWSEAIAAPDFSWKGDTRLHLGLLPQPFIGDVRNASIYILSLNPGLEPSDYYGEYEVPEYRRALMANLQQSFDHARQPFIYLDPRFSWHGGFRWWDRKLSAVIATYAHETNETFASVRAKLAGEVASVEMVPYHSSQFDFPDPTQLRSVTLVRDFARRFILERVKQGKAVAIVLRAAKLWGLPEMKGVIHYSGTEARGAHLSTGTRGGKAILETLRALQKLR